MNIDTLLRLIADNGGTLKIIENDYSPLSDEAASLGLIKIDRTSGGWGMTEKLTLTNYGRQRIGIDVVTPKPRVSVLTAARGIAAKLLSFVSS